MMAPDVIHAGRTVSYHYSPSREAIAEWYHGDGRPTRLTGWMWDGMLPTREVAIATLAEYLETWGE